MQHGIIIYYSASAASFQRALYYKKSLPNAELFLLADEKEAGPLLARGFSEIIFLPEVKTLRKDLLKYVTQPAKIRLLSEKAFEAQQAEANANVAKQPELKPETSDAPEPDASANFIPSTPIKRHKKRQKEKLKSRLLLGAILVLVVALIIFIGTHI